MDKEWHSSAWHTQPGGNGYVTPAGAGDKGDNEDKGDKAGKDERVLMRVGPKANGQRMEEQLCNSGRRG